MVPSKVNKLHLISNDLTDVDFKVVLQGLSESSGLHTLYYQQNGFGP